MEISITEILNHVLAIGLRVSGLVIFAPFWGSVVIPSRVKVVLIIAITALLYPVYSPQLGAMSLARWPVMVASETLVGVAIGVSTNLVFEGVQLTGQVLSVQIGHSLVNILDPHTEVDTTVMTVFHQTIAMLIFLELNVHHWILRAVAHSFEYLPPGSATVNPLFVRAFLHEGAMILETGIQIAAPVLAATLLADVVLGLLGKASPQMPLMLLGPAIKSMLGFFVLGATIHYWPTLFEGYFAKSMSYTEQLLRIAGH
jgi:flagellar biosynthesis protein FliR